MTDQDDKDLAKLFSAMRERDELRTPPFDAVLDAARRRGSTPVAIRPWRPALAAAAVALVVAGGWLALRPHGPAGTAMTVPVWDWRSPTASLLDVPGTHMINGMPALPGAGAPNTLDIPSLNGGIR